MGSKKTNVCIVKYLFLSIFVKHMGNYREITGSMLPEMIELVVNKIMIRKTYAQFLEWTDAAKPKYMLTLARVYLTM